MSDPHEGKRKIELGWPIFRIHHQRCRYIYEMYYIKKKISKDLYEYCIREVMMQDTYRFVLSTAMFDKFFYPSLRPMSFCVYRNLLIVISLPSGRRMAMNDCAASVV